MSSNHSAAKKSSRKKADVGWHTDEVLDTQGKQMHHFSRCAKWLKTQMEHGELAFPPNMAPFRHSGGKGIHNHTADVRNLTVLEKRSYDFFPVSTDIGAACAFCQRCVSMAIPEQVQYLKNPYTRMSWTPMCHECAEKTEF